MAKGNKKNARRKIPLQDQIAKRPSPPVLSEAVVALMREIDKEIGAALIPAFKGQSLPVGSSWDFDAAIGQARCDLRQFIIRGEPLAAAYRTASANLRGYIEKKNERYRKDYMLQRDGEHGQDKLRFDYERYRRASAN